MPQSISCGLLLFSQAPQLRVLLAHPGGPFFAKKDLGVWSIPKGLTLADEPLLVAAQREFQEETGYGLSTVEDYISLGKTKQKSGKWVHAWAFEGEWEAGRIPQSNRFEIEWPPRSGLKQSFPELEIVLNGGINTIEECKTHLQQVDGVMMGREAYSNPYIMSRVDAELYGASEAPLSRDQVLSSFIDYVNRNTSNGVRLNHMSRHVVGLFHGEPRSRLFRRHISQNAHIPGSGAEVLQQAYDAMISSQ